MLKKVLELPPIIRDKRMTQKVNPSILRGGIEA